MASLIPESSKTDFKTALNDHFDTFKETITIFKEPKKVTVKAILPPSIVLVKTSRPKLSVPNQYSEDGA